jgi:hypothetical protein
MRCNRASVQQVPRLPVRVDLPSADDPGVAEVKPALAWPIHLTIRLGDQYRLRLMDCDERWADLNLE